MARGVVGKIVNCYPSACRGEKKSGVYTIIHDSDGTRRGPLNSEIGNRAFYSLVSKRLRKSGPQTKVKVTCIEARGWCWGPATRYTTWRNNCIQGYAPCIPVGLNDHVEVLSHSLKAQLLTQKQLDIPGHTLGPASNIF